MRRSSLCLLAVLCAACLLAWTPKSSACNARKKDSIHAHLHARPSARAFLPMQAGAVVPCEGGRAGIYPCKDVDLLSFVPLSALGAGPAETGNDVWGWTDPATGNEYAVMGLSASVVFVDVSDPLAPRVLGKLPTATVGSPWRDVKVYRNHAFVVADSAGNHGLQIFDLTRLRGVTGARTFNASARYDRFGSAHNVFINEQTGFAFVLGSDTCAGGLHMVDVKSPKSPRFAGCFDADGYTHDTQCVVYGGPDARFRGRELCFAANEDTLTIVDVTDKAAPVQIARIGYEGVGYAHQPWLTNNQKFLLLDDESDEMLFGHRTRTYIWNLEDLENPRLIGRHNAPTNSIDHNLYIHRGLVFQANYQAGLRVLTTDRIAQGRLTEIAYFDIAPEADAADFGGSWSVYPFFESRTILISNIEQGLYLLRARVPGFSPPAAPTGLEATLEGLAVRLAWTDVAADEEGYRVYRRRGSGPESRIAELPAASATFLDESTEPSTRYTYRVTAFSAGGEDGTEPVEIETPEPAPVTLVLQILSAAPLETGRPINLEAVFTGPAREARWSFGAEGLALAAPPCAADRFCATHLFAEPGTHTVTVTVEDAFGRLATASQQLTLAEGPPLDVEEALVPSVILGPRGATGTFRSSVWVHNAGEEPALVRFSFLPRALGDAGRTSRSLTVAPGSTLFLGDVLGELFGIETGQGSLALRYHVPAGGESSASSIRAISRSFVDLGDGTGSTFGQLVGEDREGLWSATPKTAAGVLDGGGFLTTLLAANLDDRPGRVDVELFDAAGAPVGEAGRFALDPLASRTRQLRQLFPEAAGRTGPFTARFTSNGIRFSASATLLEVGSEDQVFVPAREEDSSTVLWVPRVARSQGQFGVFLTSWLVASNPSDSPTALSVELWLRGQNNSTPVTAERTLAPGGTLVFEDVLLDLFGVEDAAGALRLTWTNEASVAPLVQSFGFASTGNGSGAEPRRFGMRIGTLGTANGIAERGVQFGAEQSDLFRSSYGVVNLLAGRTKLRLTLRTAAGAQIATAELTLRSQQHLERNLAGIFPGLGEGASWTLETEVLEGGPVLTYLANINLSGDVFFVPGGQGLDRLIDVVLTAPHRVASRQFRMSGQCTTLRMAAALVWRKRPSPTASGAGASRAGVAGRGSAHGPWRARWRASGSPWP